MLALVAICLIAIVGVVAVALDGGLLLDQRRRVQAAADAAALAAAYDLYGHYASNNGADTGGTAQASALSNAAANGYSNDGTASVVTVHIPPTSGNYVGLAGYAEVIVQSNQPRAFSNFFGSGNLPVAARAVARGRWAPFQQGVILLDPTGKAILSAKGNGNVTVTGASVVVDSNNSQAAVATGNGNLLATEFDITGVPGTSTSGGGTFNGTIKNGVTPTPDPLSYVPPPDTSTLTVRATSSLSVKTTTTLSPGWYQGGISVTGGQTGDTLTLQSGIYYLGGGGLSTNSKINIVGNGVMLYLDSGAALSLGGNGNVTLSPMTTGAYQGLTVFENRNSTTAMNLAGNGTMQISGTLYAPHAAISMVGNGLTNQVGSQVIAYSLNLSGNGALNVTWTANATARARVLGLVE